VKVRVVVLGLVSALVVGLVLALAAVRELAQVLESAEESEFEGL
jgi:hypothetical protein